MEISFYQFCSASREGYDSLRRSIELCAARGQSYEFPSCLMPAGCTPARALLGFSRQRDGCWLLYWRPLIDYSGPSRVLAALFRRGAWRFESFEAMTGRLRSLCWELGRTPAAGPATPAAAPAQRPRPQAVTSDQAWPLPYLQLAEELSQSVLGQERAVSAAAFRLYSHINKKEPARPLSLIFYGPTGVGKSELGKAIAPALGRCFDRRYQFIWTELNTFTQAHSVHRLTGAPPGYVGYDDQPVFEAVRQNPNTVFMFDELEKAHPEVLKVFMSILDEGRLTAHRADDDGQRELDFRRCIFVFTTNSDLSAPERPALGFSCRQEAPLKPAQKKAATPAELAEQLFDENETARRAMVRQGVLAEIAGRFGGFIGFGQLDKKGRAAVTAKQITALAREFGLDALRVEPDTLQSLTPDREALSVRSMAGVLEGMLTPLLSQAALSGHGAFLLAGRPGSLRLVPDYTGLSSSTLPVSTFSL